MENLFYAVSHVIWGGGEITRIINNSRAITLHLLDLEHAR